MANSEYNPDVLNCIANLSNDEVFTPPVLANQVLDMLPQELFRSPDTRFLDPFCKSGVFLREIVKRLDRGLANLIPNRQKRIDHIMHHQVYGMALTELTALLSRRTLYCSKAANSPHSVSYFDDEQGHLFYKAIPHTWVKGKCKYCGASQDVYDRGSQSEQYAYQFIHTDNPEQLFPKDMKFDVIIGNPPYQLSDGGNAASAKPLYHLFVSQAQKLNPRYLCMIIPARWYAGGKGLDNFRDNMLKDGHISYLADFPNSSDCFAGVNIAGGICYFLWERDKKTKLCEVENFKNALSTSTVKRNLSDYPYFVRDNDAINIITKIRLLKEETIDKKVFSRNSFNLHSNERGHELKGINDCLLLSSDGIAYIPKNKVKDKENIINKYKVIITYAMSGGNKPGSDGKYQIISSLSLLLPNEVCTETYLVVGAFGNAIEANNLISYIKTKFFRFLLLQALSSIHITRSTFAFVPLQDFSHPWTDEMLYKKYGLDENEVAFIESMIRPME